MSKKKGGGPFDALKELKKKLAEEEAQKSAPQARPAAKPVRRAEVPSTSSSGSSSEEDEALTFHRMMSGVVPIDRSAHGRVPMSKEVPRSSGAEQAMRRAGEKTIAVRERDEVREHLRMLVEAQARFEIADDGRRVEGRRVDLPPDVLRKLRRGLFPIDARLDMHGMRAGEARPALEEFLRAKRATGERCVLVVHGKGEHSPGGVGVLRGEVAAWLSQGKASEHVAAFATATESDGGEGAVYVLIRRV